MNGDSLRWICFHRWTSTTGEHSAGRPGYPYPMNSLTLETEAVRPITAVCISECRAHLVGMLRDHARDLRPSGLVHRPPVLGGVQYDSTDYEDCTDAVRECMNYLVAAGPVLLRGVASLIKAHIAWKHSEFWASACIHLWIALDAAFSLTLEKLRSAGTRTQHRHTSTT